jgi:large subunit ribosomal protein L15
MRLDDLRPAPGSNKKRKRVGRGDGSGHGKTSCRGHKGQGARSGGNVQPGFEGGQMPLQRRLPKRGFFNPFRVEISVVNLSQLEKLAESGEIGPENLAAHGLIGGKNRRVKILGEGSLTRALTIKAHGFSASAKAKIEAAGGKAELIAIHD